MLYVSVQFVVYLDEKASKVLVYILIFNSI